jgi:hypothetical protein
MTIALVTSGKQAASSGSTNTVTIPLTVSGSDTVLLVFATSANSGDRLSGGSSTWNGVSMGSPIASITTLSNHFPYAWLIVAPAAGSFNVVVTANANAVFCAGAIVLSGVDQTTPVSATTGIGTLTPTSPFSSAVTVPSGGLAVDWFGARANGATITPDVSQTQIGSPATIDFNGQYGASYKAAATAMAWSYTGSPNVTHLRVALNAVVTSSGDLSGAATLGDVSANGSIESLPNSTLAGGATLGDISASGSLAASIGVITTPVLKNNTGTILSSVSGVVANVYHPTTGALVVRKTGLSSNGSGIVTITDAALVPGTSYSYEIDLSAASLGRRLPVGVAA